MTDVLSKWATYRKTTHTDYEADTLGDEMAKEIERLRRQLTIIGSFTTLMPGGGWKVTPEAAIAKAALQGK